MTPADVTDLVARLDALEDRLAALAERPLPAATTEPDPDNEERWEPAQVWAHVSELIPYWLGEARRIVDAEAAGPVRYGRLATDAIRVDAIEQRRHWSQDERWAGIRADLDDVRRFTRELDPAGLDKEGLHPTGNVRTVRFILERSIAAHLEEHADQLERLAASAPGPDRAPGADAAG